VGANLKNIDATFFGRVLAAPRPQENEVMSSGETLLCSGAERQKDELRSNVPHPETSRTSRMKGSEEDGAKESIPRNSNQNEQEI